jgi:2-dehydro-3-deoxy-D-arabinonate dehydratase
MKLYKTSEGPVILHEDRCYIPAEKDWDRFINRDNLFDLLNSEINNLQSQGDSEWLSRKKILAPIGTQEVWAAGVTYLRSKTARMEESRESGAATFYDKVYEAERPELFFKATAHRVSGPDEPVNIRKDSSWNVPEPELTLFITSKGNIVGYTIGNDMSSRSIEGENPLYLPQAKVYDRSAALGPCLYIASKPISPSTEIAIQIFRNGNVLYEGRTLISQMKRNHSELVEYLFRESSFPQGVFLMTGTCLVPENDFTLQSRDEIQILIEPIGKLVNWVS